MRPLRVLLVANDGFSAGHVARAVAIAGGLGRVGERRGLAVQCVLATTSEAEALWRGAPVTVVRLPAPDAGRRGGLGDAARRGLVRGAIAGVAAGFAPDLVVADTFPSGPHGELAGLGDAGRKRALVRRATAAQGALPPALDGALTAGLAAYDLAVVVADPGPTDADLTGFGGAIRQVAPIARIDGALDRAAARARLGLGDGPAFLVAAGGGGDGAAVARAAQLAHAIARLAPDATVVVARGPLAADDFADLAEPRIRPLRLAPLATVLRAFDGAFAPAGYNTAHELAALGVPAALFAQPRTFDDQAARAGRLAAGGWAHALTRFDDDAIAAALAWIARARIPALATGGELEAADALIDLVTGPVAGLATGGRA